MPLKRLRPSQFIPQYSQYKRVLFRDSDTEILCHHSRLGRLWVRNRSAIWGDLQLGFGSWPGRFWSACGSGRRGEHHVDRNASSWFTVLIWLSQEFDGVDHRSFWNRFEHVSGMAVCHRQRSHCCVGLVTFKSFLGCILTNALASASPSL